MTEHGNRLLKQPHQSWSGSSKDRRDENAVKLHMIRRHAGHGRVVGEVHSHHTDLKLEPQREPEGENIQHRKRNRKPNRVKEDKQSESDSVECPHDRLPCYIRLLAWCIHARCVLGRGRRVAVLPGSTWWSQAGLEGGCRDERSHHQ